MTEPVNITLLLDRFLSASTAADVQNALEHVLSALQDPSATEALLAEPDVLKGMLKLLATQSYKNVGVEDGDNLCARILWQILQTSDTAKTLLQRPELALIEVLMDVAATNEDESIERSSYTRVLCLQSLEKLCHQAPQLAQQQLLQAPNGLHRLGELLHCADLAVRNQALLVAHCCAAWPAVSQVWIFLNIVPTLLQVALQEGGLQGGTVVVQDCLRLLRNLLRHDTSMAELVFQEQTLAPQLSVLLDLRLGTEFVHPVAKKKIEPLLSRKKAVDDLDDLLMEPSSNQESSSDEEIILPRLTRDEEKVIHAVLDILELVLENNKVRQAICTQDLASMVWELGLVNFPPPGVAAPCAYPSASLQQRALQITARYLNDPILLQNHNALHRLLHLVCMGGIPKDREDKLGVSQSALHLLRQTVPPAQAQEILLNTLAPPLTEETPDLTPVQRLLITVENNLVAPPDTGRTVLLVGSTCALSLFLVDTASREMMVRLMDSGLLPSILELLPNEPDTLVTLVLLRFLCQWMDGSPLVVQSILGAPQSATVLAALLESKDSTIAAYASLLLGMALNQMTDQQDVTKYGGWTREGILDIFKHSLKLFLLRLDELGPNLNMWSFCPLEHKVWLEEFQANVWTVRRCLVAEMTVHSESSDEISSMQALIEKQSSELEELRQELNFSKKSLVQQEKELLLWKVRAECTPTQLDELLNQSTSRNTALEKKVEELESLLYHIEAEHAADVSRNTELVESLQAEVQNALQNETQTREDLETMQGEMTALSQAYTNLEAEYRRQTELLSTSTAGAEGSEQSAHQNQGEDSEKELSRGNSTEVAILRAENTRLKNDMKVAEDWMAMAHQKLSEILTENTALKGEVSSLRGQVQSLGDQSAGLQQELNSLREYYGSSSNEDLRSIISKTSQQAELETNLREEAESELIHIRGLLEKVEKDKADLEQRMSEMNQMFISENAATFGHSQPKTLPAENDTVNLHEEVEAVRKELAFVLKREEEAISNRDARISELESCLDERGFPSEELLRRDKEIEELKQLTQVAQEWMDNAIEQYHALQQDKEALLSEKATLTNQLSELDNQIQTLIPSISMATAQPDLQALTLALQEKDSLLKESMATLSEMQVSLTEKEHNLDSLRFELQSANEEIQQKCSELELLRQNSNSAANEIQHLRAQAKALTSREQELCKEIDDLRNGQSSNQDLVEGLHVEENSSQSNLLLQIEEYKTMMRNLEAQLSEQECDSNDMVKEWETTYTDLEKRHKEVLGEKQKLEDLCSAKDARIYELQDENRSKNDEVNELTILLEEKVRVMSTTNIVDTGEEENREDKDATIKTLSDEVETLKQQLQAMDAESVDAISRWQASYADLEARYLELCNSKETPVVDGKDAVQLGLEDGSVDRVSELTSQVTRLQQALTEAESESAAVVAKWQEAYAELEDKVRVASADESGMGADVQASNDALSDRVSELNALVTSLQEQLREADAEHATVLEKWQQGYAELEEKVRVMSTTNIVDTGEEENREDKDATIKTLSDEVKTLKQQLQAMDAESVDAISRWQASYADLEARYLELCNSKETPVVDGKDAVQLGLEDGSVDRVSELTSQVTRLQQALTEAESESAAVVAKWQEAYAELEGKVRISSPDNNLVADISCSDKDKNLRLDDVVRQTETFKQHGQDRERYDEVSHEIALLRSQLLEQETEAQDAIRQWEISYAELEERLLKVTKEHDCALSSGSPGIVDPPFLESAADKKSMSDNEADTQIAMGDNNFLDAFRELEQRVSKLTSEVSFLQRELVDSEKEAANAISTWEQAYANLEAELQLAKKNNCERHDSEDVDDRDSLLTKMTIHIATLNEQLLLYQTQLNSRTAMNKSDQVNSQVGDSTANINDGTVTQLEVSLNTDADAAFAEQRYNEGPEESSQSSLQAEVYRLQCNIKVMQEEKQTSVAELQERLASATSEMVETKQQLGLLKTELEQNRLQANEKAEFIKQLSLERDLLSESFRRLEDQYEKDVLAFNLERKVLEDDLFSTREELNSKTMQAKKLTNDLRESQEALSQMELKMRGADEEDKLRVLLDEKTAALVLLEEDLSLKTFELQSKSAEWEKAKEREAELEREISRLQSELSDQKEEAEIAIASWETRCEELEELCKFSQDDKDKLNDALERAGTLETRLRETEELFNARLETAISEHDRVQKAIADTLRLQTQAEHERLELIVSTLQNEKAVLIAERDNLTTRVAELEDEVLESRDAMRFCITNGMSDKAFEIATQSLLEQLNQMSEQAASNAASLVMERQGRQAAEEEVRRLRSDLALILGMENGNENVAEIQKLTLKTKGYIQRKEAAEIQSLRSSLERAQAELSGSKASEMESKERSAKANIRATALEQELISSRNDFQYLVKTMEEMREAELSRRVSFEYRIDSLENDKAMLKKIQATEIDNLRNELNQICIERDRLFVSLKDSEKSKEAVMLASNRAQLSNLNEESDLHAELDILRIEKARLLAATADETLQFERRLRDAVAAERSSSEADLILEKELRLAAERSVDALKHELEQMQVDLDRPVHPDDALSTTEAIPTSHEMVELKAQIESLLMEKRNLKSQVDTIKAESQRRIEELARECREAKSEALRVERESLFEAELQAEMSRVQNNGSFRRNEVDTEESQGIFEEKKDAMQLEHLQRLYEAIKDQKETIEEERSVYFELLSEQDDLLALLAQQDLMESCLKAALCRLGGAEAVEEAAQEAREKAEAQYGKYIEVSAVEST
ncbi:hypothetical protein FisN_19Lh186 [Fistulifera solaris]|uniref:Vesicle tethering protein Uso1/P115-like head domain-containing protein n=1 Tax=Fistulifera solaris TaxID=1519565 RepID=A0A1Z5J7C0_FISSO|nr:hypothetical protein FisN_19Lh186 [Fistulifera solaris]|eukprot:GAX09718.1 hypothetical protein FisN_19Lh186 [Fistulifera solaris]